MMEKDGRRATILNWKRCGLAKAGRDLILFGHAVHGKRPMDGLDVDGERDSRASRLALAPEGVSKLDVAFFFSFISIQYSVNLFV